MHICTRLIQMGNSVFKQMIPVFIWTLIAVIALCIPASNAAHIDCTWDTYRDKGTNRCEPCSNLCLPARGMMEECRRRCEDFLQRKAADAEPVVDNKEPVEDKDEPEGNLPGWATALVVVLVVLISGLISAAILYKINKCKRRNTQHADQDTSVMQPMDPAGDQPEEEDRPCHQDTSVMQPMDPAGDQPEEEDRPCHQDTSVMQPMDPRRGVQPVEEDGPCCTVTNKTTV